MKHRIINGLIIVALIAFAGVGIANIRVSHQKIQIDKIQLQDVNAKLKLLNERYNNLNLQLDQTGADKTKLEEQLKQLEKEKADLQAQISARQLKTSAVAVAEGYTAPSGTCTDWLTAAGVNDLQSALELIKRESNCNPYAVNASSGACGIGQALPCSKMGCSMGDGYCQVRWMNSYVTARYGTWAAALQHSYNNGWY
jgi:hypothetical protein